MGRYITTTGTAGVTTREVSTTFSATVNDRILANTASSGFTITLPANSSLLVSFYIVFSFLKCLPTCLCKDSCVCKPLTY